MTHDDRTAYKYSAKDRGTPMIYNGYRIELSGQFAHIYEAEGPNDNRMLWNLHGEFDEAIKAIDNREWEKDHRRAWLNLARRSVTRDLRAAWPDVVVDFALSPRYDSKRDETEEPPWLVLIAIVPDVIRFDLNVHTYLDKPAPADLSHSLAIRRRPPADLKIAIRLPRDMSIEEVHSFADNAKKAALIVEQTQNRLDPLKFSQPMATNIKTTNYINPPSNRPPQVRESEE